MITRLMTRTVCVLGLLSLFCLFACSPTPTAQNDDGTKKLRIAAILFQEDQFFRMCELGMRAAAKEYGAELLVSNSFNTLDKEISLVETYVSQGVDALVVAPLSITASIPALQRAHERGIPVVTYDGYIKADFPKSNIKSDQIALGRQTGEVAREYIEKRLGGKAKVALIEYISLAPEPGGMRVQGFKDAIANLPGVEIVAEQDAWLAPQATDVVMGILTAKPDVDIVWAANEGGTIGAVTAVRNSGKQGRVVVFGTDMSEQIADFLLAEDGVLQAVTGQKPFDIGQLAVTYAIRAIKGEAVESAVSLPGILFRREDRDRIVECREFLRSLSAR